MALNKQKPEHSDAKDTSPSSSKYENGAGSLSKAGNDPRRLPEEDQRETSESGQRQSSQGHQGMGAQNQSVRS